MRNQSHALATGAFVLLLTAAVVAAAVWLTGNHAARVPYLLVSHDPVTGLNSESAVFYRGVRVGTVKSIRLDPRNFQDILVRVNIDRDVPITRGTYGSVQSEGLMGPSAIELDDSGQNRAPLPTSQPAPGRIPLGPSFLATLTHSSGRLISRLSRLTADLDRFASPANEARLAETLTDTDATMRKLQVALASIPSVSYDMRRTLSHIDALSENLQTLSGSLIALSHHANRFVRTGTSASKVLRDTTLPHLDRLLGQLGAETQQLRQLTVTLRRDPQMLLYGRQHPAPGPGESGDRR